MKQRYEGLLRVTAEKQDAASRRREERGPSRVVARDCSKVPGEVGRGDELTWGGRTSPTTWSSSSRRGAPAAAARRQRPRARPGGGGGGARRSVPEPSGDAASQGGGRGEEAVGDGLLVEHVDGSRSLV